VSAPAPQAAAASASYRAVLALPGALRAFLPAMVGRLSFAMVTLALLLLIQSATGSFAAAGLATGAFGLANVLASPARARLVDARGQRPVLVALAIGHALALVGLLAAVRADAPTAVVVAATAAAGLCLPPLGAAMRVLWAASAPDVRMRTRAYSLDTVGEDLAFTVGPLLVALLVAVADPTAAVLVSGCATVAGTLGMTSAPLSRGRGARRVAATAVVREPGTPASVARRRRFTLRDEDPSASRSSCRCS
jgi:MFS family permease